MIVSDGVGEAQNAAGEFFGELRLIPFLAASSELRGGDLHAALIGEIQQWSDSESLADDLSVIIVDRET